MPLRNKFANLTDSEWRALNPELDDDQLVFVKDRKQIKLSKYGVPYAGWDIFGSVLSGTYFYTLEAFGDAVSNAVKLQELYNQLKELSVSTGHKITMLVPPGLYTFAVPGSFNIDSSGVDIVSLTGRMDVTINGYLVSTGSVLIRGVNSTSTVNVLCLGGNDYDYTNVAFESCCIPSGSFNNNTITSGHSILLPSHFKNCYIGMNCFNTRSTSSTFNFIECEVGSNCFGGIDKTFLNAHRSVFSGSLPSSAKLSNSFFNSCDLSGLVGSSFVFDGVSKFLYCYNISSSLKSYLTTSGQKVLFCVGADGAAV